MINVRSPYYTTNNLFLKLNEASLIERLKNQLIKKDSNSKKIHDVIKRDRENHNLQDLLRISVVREIPAFRRLGDAFAVLRDPKSTREQRTAATEKVLFLYKTSHIASLLEGLRTIAGSGALGTLRLDWSKITRQVESVRKKLASDPLSLKMFNAIHSFMRGGAATANEIQKLSQLLKSASAASVSKSLKNVNIRATLAMRQELVARYRGMSQEQLSAEISKHGIPANVLQAAKELTAQGRTAPGLYEVNVARKLAQIKKYENAVSQFLSKKKWASYSDISKRSWSDIPADIQAAVKNLIEFKRGVHVYWGGGTSKKTYFGMSNGAGALADLYLSLTVDGSAYLADLKDKANSLVLAIKLLTALLSKPPSAGADSKSYAKEAVEYADSLKKQLAIVFGDRSSEGVLKEFTDSLASASEYGISKNGLDNQLKIAFPNDISGDGKVENSIAGFFKEISGLIAGKGGLLDVAIEAIEKTQKNYGASLDKQSKAQMAAIFDMVFGIACAGASISAGALKVSTSIQDLVKKGPNFRKALGDLLSTVGGALGLAPTLRRLIQSYQASKTKVDLLKHDSPLSSSIAAISEKLDQLQAAFFNLYRRLGPDLPTKKRIGNFSDDIELTDPGLAGPYREGYLVTWWEKKRSDSGPFWILYGLPLA